jgi:hypothetical protein
MNRRRCLLLLAFALAAAPARADEVLIYQGPIRSASYSTIATDPVKQGLYVILDNTTQALGFVYYDAKKRTHSESTIPLTFNAIRPNAPIGPTSQLFVYAGAPEAGATPVDVHRLRNVGKLAMQPISSTATQLIAKAFAYSNDFVALAAYNAEASGKLKYQRKLTVASNDANLDLAGATALILDDLRARGLID